MIWNFIAESMVSSVPAWAPLSNYSNIFGRLEHRRNIKCAQISAHSNALAWTAAE
jgi:hypothetical protein